MVVDVEVERAAETLDQGDSTRTSRCMGMPRFLDQVRGNDAVDDPQHLAHDHWPAGEQEAQRKWEAQDPLAHRLLGQNFIDQQRRTFGHASRPATGAEAAAFATEGNQVLDVTRLTAHPQKAMFQPAAFEVILELALHIARQLPVPLRQMGDEGRVVLLNNLVEQRLFGPVALVTTSIPVPGGRPGRRVRHDPHPYSTVFLHSISLNCGILKPQL